MAFEMITKGTHYSLNAYMAEVKMCASLADGERQRSLIFVYSLKVLKDMDIDINAEPRPRMAILEGTGEDQGFMKLLLHPKGYMISQYGSSKVSFSISTSVSKLKHYVLNECPAPMTDVEFSTDANEHSMLIEAPDWLRFNPQSAPPKLKQIEGPKETFIEKFQRKRA